MRREKNPRSHHCLCDGRKVESMRSPSTDGCQDLQRLLLMEYLWKAGGLMVRYNTCLLLQQWWLMISEEIFWRKRPWHQWKLCHESGKSFVNMDYRRVERWVKVSSTHYMIRVHLLVTCLILNDHTQLFFRGLSTVPRRTSCLSALLIVPFADLRQSGKRLWLNHRETSTHRSMHLETLIAIWCSHNTQVRNCRPTSLNSKWSSSGAVDWGELHGAWATF